MDSLTEEERLNKIKELQHEKVQLLDKYGLFGGGEAISILHNNINKQLESLGVPEYA
jgi:hypothetical protein